MPNNSYPDHLGAYHDSTNAYGTWSFDWIVPSEIDWRTEITVFFISNIPVMLNGSDPEPPTLNSYSITLTSVFEPLEHAGLYITLGEHNYGIWRSMNEYSYPDPLIGVFHIDITRDTDGTFRVYANSSRDPIIEQVNNRYKTSERLSIWNWNDESAVDNIVVYDTVEITPNPKTSSFPGVEVLLLILPLGIPYSRKRRY